MRRTIGTALLGMAAIAALSACSEGRGYGGVNVGVGFAGGGYYDDPYYGQAYGYGGWYDGFYYPGSGYYVYDRGGRRSRWNDNHRHYWEGRRAQWQRADPAQREAWRQERQREGQPAWRGNRGGQAGANPGIDRPRGGYRGVPGGRIDAGARAAARAERGAARVERRGADRQGAAVGRERAPRTQPQ